LSDKDDNIIKRLDVIARLLALNLPASINQDQKIKILDEMDLGPKEIASILGTTPNTVSVELNKIKKTNKKQGD